jgi:transcriptional regulator with XRE-family HTH domain
LRKYLKKMQENFEMGQRLRQAREQKGLNKSKLGDLVGTSGTSINNIEKGETKNPSADLLVKIASILGVGLDWLLYGKAEQAGGFSNVQTAKAHNIQGTHISTGGDQSQRIAELEREVEKWRSKYIELLEKQVGG